MERWQNQEEAYQFAMSRPAAMLAMDMGTGKTRVAIDIAVSRHDVHRVLVVCPRAVMEVWPKELAKHVHGIPYRVYTKPKGGVMKAAEGVRKFLSPSYGVKSFVVLNYDSVWRDKLGEEVLKAGFDMVILDESHRAKSAGSKVSRFLAMVGKRTKYRLCLTGTPMANSPLDVYGQYRFLDPSIFGTNHGRFLQEYAIMGGPERRFVVGFKNQKDLSDKFNSIAYTCKMSDMAQRLKLPEVLPPIVREVNLPQKDMKVLKDLSKDFIAEVSSGNVIVPNNVLTRALRMQQIAAGFCLTQTDPMSEPVCEEMNKAKAEALEDLLTDLDSREKLVVFCQFKHDLDAIYDTVLKSGRQPFELSGKRNQLDYWKESARGDVLAVQIQAGAEGIDMTCANHAVYFTLPYSLALYDQSKARLYRPGQTTPVSFIHLIAAGTIDELIYASLQNKRSLIDAIREGRLDYGVLK